MLQQVPQNVLHQPLVPFVDRQVIAADGVDKVTGTPVKILADGTIILKDDVYVVAEDLRNLMGYVGGVLYFGAPEDRSTFIQGWANQILMIDGEIDYMSLIHAFTGDVRLDTGTLSFAGAALVYSGGALYIETEPGLPRSYFGSPDADQSTVIRAYNSSITLSEDMITFDGDGIFQNSVVATFGVTTTSGKSSFAAATINYASINIGSGIRPSVFNTGDVWYDGSVFGFQNGSLTKELFNGEQARVTTQFDKTSSTTLSNITGLTANLAAGKIYRFEAKLFTTSNVAGGVKAAIAGTATATSIVYEGLTTNAGLTTQTRGAAMAASVGAVTAVTAGYITIEGLIVVNAAGTLTVQFAQNASNAAASSVLVGSSFVVTQIL